MAIIGKIRKRAGLAVVFVAIAILAFVFNDLFSRQSTAPADIVKVNGVGMSANKYLMDVENAENLTKQQYQTNALTQEQSYAIKNQVFETAIRDLLLEEQYEKLGIMVTKTEMNDMFLGDFIHPIASGQFTDPKTGQYNRQAINRYLSNFSQLPVEEQNSWKQFEQYVHNSRLSEKYERLLGVGFYMPKEAAAFEASVYDQVADVRYVKMPVASIADDQVKLTEEDYEKYYEERKSLFHLTEEIRDIDFVKFSVFPSQQDLKTLNDSANRAFEALSAAEEKDISSIVNNYSDFPFDSTYIRPEQLRNMFPDSLLKGLAAGVRIAPMQINQKWMMGRVISTDNRPDSVRFAQILILNNTLGYESITRTKEEAKQYADSVYQILKTNPASFESSIVTYSDDPEAANNFGDSKWMSEVQVPGPLYQEIRTRNKGDIFLYELPSGVGYAVIKITGKTEPVFKTQVAVISIEIHPSDATINEVRDKAHRFIGSVKDIEQMKTVAEEQNINLLSASVRETDYNMQGLSYAREIVRWAYNKDTKTGTVSGDVYELSDAFVVAGLKDIKKKGTLPLKQIKDLIENDVRNEKKLEMLLAKAQEAVKGQSSLENIASKLQLPIDTAVNCSFSDGYFVKEGPEMRVIGAVSAANKAELMQPVKGYGAAYIVQVDKVSKREQKTDAMAVMQRFLSDNMRKTNQLNFPVQVLKEKAKIESNFNFYQ